jgi:branched-chain amino acid transport system permease protein
MSEILAKASSKRWRDRAGWLALILVAVAGPLVVRDGYGRSLLVLIGIYCMLALSYDIIVGHAGVISFGHAGFFAVGAYGMGLLTTYWDWPLVASLAAAVTLSVLVSLLIGLISLRISGHHFAVATLAFAELLRLVLLNVDEVTRGPLGLLIPPGTVELVPGVVLQGPFMFHTLAWGGVLLTVYVMARLRQTRIGWSFLGIRENEALASAVGIFPLKIKLIAFALSGGLAAIAGAVYGAYYGVLTPEVSGTHYTALALLMVMLGGRGTLSGPIIGAAAFVFLPELLGLEGSWNEVMFGVILLVVLRVLPFGVARGLSLTRGRRAAGRTAAEPAVTAPTGGGQ